MIADAFDHCDRARVAHAEPLADDAPDEALAARRSVQDDVAGDDVLFGDEVRMPVARRPGDDPPARQALGEVVVGIALEAQRDALRHEGTERLPGRPRERDLDRVVGQADGTEPLGDLVAEDGAHGAVHVADRQLERDGRPVLQRTLAQLHERLVERAVEAVVLALGAVPVLFPRRLGHVQDGREVEALRLPVIDGLACVERLHVADGLGH